MTTIPSSPDGPTPPISRRGFLHTAGGLGLLASVQQLAPAYAQTVVSAAFPRRTRLQPPSTAARPIDLLIQETPITIGKRRAMATTMNGTVPGPLLRLREGEDVEIRVTNRLKEDTSIHWHGMIVPNPMDGVPGVNFPGIRPAETFTYRLPIRQYGTYWYHSHSGLQEQTGHYGPIIIDPAEPDPVAYDREYVVMLSDWTFENPYKVLDRLKKWPGYYNFQRRTVGDFFRDTKRRGLGATLRDRLEWGRMRMDPTDLSDITGATYTFLVNGLAPAANWTALFRPGERVRLRFINAGAATYFDVRIPNLEMTVVQVSGQNVRPVATDEFRIAIAETYDVIVQPEQDQAYTIFAEAVDRSGYARGTLAPRPGMSALIPRRRPRPVLTMADMGMAMDMPGHDMPGMDMPGKDTTAKMPGMDMGKDTTGEMMPGHKMPGHDMQAMRDKGTMDTSRDAGLRTPDGSIVRTTGLRAPGTVPETVMHGPDKHGPTNSSTPMSTRSRLHEPGFGLGNDGWRVLVYEDLRSLKPVPDFGPPEREIEMHLTGNMERFIWSINGIKFSDVKEPLRLRQGERLRLTMVNDSMMQHPMHLHGMWMQLENGAGRDIPRVHTINVKPAERLSVLVTPNDPGPWAFHCHILYHMEVGMFRVFEVSAATTAQAGR